MEGQYGLRLVRWLVVYERDQGSWSRFHRTYYDYITHYKFCTWEHFQGFKQAMEVLTPDQIDRIGDTRTAIVISQRQMTADCRAEVIQRVIDAACAQRCPVHYQLATVVLDDVAPLPVRPRRVTPTEEERDAYRNLHRTAQEEVERLRAEVARLQAENQTLTQQIEDLRGRR